MSPITAYQCDSTASVKLAEPRTFVSPLPEVDLQAVRERVGNDVRLVRMLVSFFLTEAPVLVKRIRQAAEAESSGDVHALAHHLKGLAANVNANAVRTLAQKLEDQARGQHRGDMAATISELQTHVERAVCFFQQSRLTL